MITFRQFVSEGKQVGIVYHFTTNPNLFKILTKNCLDGYNGRISTTRNKHFHKHYRIGMEDQQCRIKLDGNKISHKYKITPYNDFNGLPSKEEYIHSGSQDETEEVILTRELTNLASYILGITLFVPSERLLDKINAMGIPYDEEF